MQLRITKKSPSYWVVALDNPPLNVFGQEMIDELKSLLDELEGNTEINVLVFESTGTEFFMAHLDLLGADKLDLSKSEQGLSPWPDLAIRMEGAPFVTIGKLRGRARGVGSEFLLGMDMRFASRENSSLAQIEVPLGLIPGGGGMERLPQVVGRSRAIEIIIGGEDFNADTAERYGWINRAIPDAELDSFVDNLATRISLFDREAVSIAKGLINKRGLTPAFNDLNETEAAFFGLLTKPEYAVKLAKLFGKGLQQDSELERNLGTILGEGSFINSIK